MNGDQGMNILYLVLCMVLVASSLICMRLPVGKAAKMLFAWVAIFGVAFSLFTFRSEFSALGAKLRAEATGSPIEAGEELRVAMRDDGHFYVDASVNGTPARFLVDSGASVTVLSSKVAAAAGVERGLRVADVQTANGNIRMPVATVGRFEVGGIARPEFTVFLSSDDQLNVIGMNFLSSLASWRVEGRTLVLQP